MSGKAIGVACALLVTGATAWKFGMSPELREQATTWHDECGDFSPFYKSDGVSVRSCSPFIDRTTQEETRGAFTYIPEPGSTVELDSGKLAVALHIQYEPGIPSRLFNQDEITLSELDQTLQDSGEETRAYCVDDMRRVVDFVQSHATEYSVAGVTAYEIGSADNAYSTSPAGRLPNDQEIPDLHVYDADSPLSPEKSLITCWTP